MTVVRVGIGKKVDAGEYSSLAVANRWGVGGAVGFGGGFGRVC